MSNATSSVSVNGLAAGLLSGAVIAAIIAAGINLWLARRRSLEEERARVRITLAEAFEVYSQYKEFPYAIRRRRHDESAAERVRLSEALREVQSKLSYYVVWTTAEAPAVGQRYAELVAELRKTAGGAMRDAWLAKPITEDAAMNIPPSIVDLSSLKLYEEAYLRAVSAHMQELTSWSRTWRRS